MKRLVILLLSVLIAAGMCGCGGGKGDGGESTPKSDFNIKKIKTLGEAMAVEADSRSAGWSDKQYVYVFEYEGRTYRVKAPMTPELNEKVGKVDFFADDKDAQIAEVVGAQELESVEDLTDGIPAQKELDKLAGKSGAELLDEGYEPWGHYYDGEQLEFTMAKGDYEYTVTFNENIEPGDDFDETAALSGLTVKSVEYSGVSSSATDPDF